MNIHTFTESLNEFAAKEANAEIIRKSAYNDMVKTLLGVRTVCIPPRAQSTFDNLPIKKIPQFLTSLKADPLAISDINFHIEKIEDHLGRNLGQLNLKIIQETILKSRNIDKHFETTATLKSQEHSSQIVQKPQTNGPDEPSR